MLVAVSQGARGKNPGVVERPSPDERRWDRSFAFPHDRDPGSSILHGASDLRFVSRGEAAALFKRRKRQIECHVNQVAHGQCIKDKRVRAALWGAQAHPVAPYKAERAAEQQTTRTGRLSPRSEAHTSELQSLMRISY